ncbi:MAG: hypothetical protein WC479_08955 [Candidatus Izemoplasmatales bacterium]|jgi:hypothetical protein|nr:hypothetical protein [Candidatus Cloacimonadota bacterium]
MKEKTDNQKLIKSLKNVNNVGLFIPIFYTLVFGLVIMAAIVLPADEINNRILMLVVFPLLIILCWTLYAIGKKKEKEIKKTFDKLEVVLDSDRDVEEDISDEQAQIYAKKIQVLNDKFQNYVRYIMYLSICVLFFALLILLLNIIGSPQWILITLLVFLLVFIIYLSIMGYIKYKKFYEYIKMNFKDE